MSGENIKGAMQSNWGPNDYNNMMRNNIFFSMIYNAYTYWSDKYNDSLKETIFNKVLLELNTYYKNFELKYDENKKYINVCHATDHFMPFRNFYDGDFVKEQDYYMGDYEVVYTDGTIYKEPVIYGKNIASLKLDLEKNKSEIRNVSGATIAEKIGEDMYYNWMFENKYPDKEIKDIRFVSSDKFDAMVVTKEIRL